MRDDPVLVRRARLARLASLGQTAGYGLVALAVVGFAVGLVFGFTAPVTTVVSAALIGTVLTLAPAIILGYAVKAAERQDRQSQN